MLDAGLPVVIRMAAGLKNVIEPDYIRLYIGVRIYDRVTYSRLSREINHDRRLICPKNIVYKISVGNRAFNESP